MAKYSKADIRKMRRAYLKTQSLSLAAKICGCSPRTIVRYRDMQGWLTPGQIAKHKPDAGGSTLTADIATKLANGWREDISDETLCSILSLTISQLKNWLYKNTVVTIPKTITTIRPDGSQSTVTQAETIGLRDLRTRERGILELDYLQRHARMIKSAETDKDYRTAMRGVEWRLEKRFPKKYGAQSHTNVNVNTAVQANMTMSVDDLKLDLDTRRKILAAIRDGKNGNGQKKELPGDVIE